MNSRNYEELNHYILDSFTKGGTPLPTMLGSKQEWMTTVITAGLLANEKISAAIDAEGIVDAAIGIKICKVSPSVFRSDKRLDLAGIQVTF